MKTLLILLLSTIILYAENHELKLYEKIIPSIFNTNTIVVYVEERSKDIFTNSDVFIVSKSCEEADLIIGKSANTQIQNCQNKPVFATSYRTFNTYKNVIGAFYWRKGRPQIKFKKEGISKFNLNLPDELQRYLD